MGLGGNSYGIYGGASGSIITFSGGITVARAGMLDSKYTVPNANTKDNYKYFTSYRYAVYNINGDGNTDASNIIVLDKTRIAGAVGYSKDNGTAFRLLTAEPGEFFGAVKIYVDADSDGNSSSTKPPRTVIGIDTATNKIEEGNTEVVYDGTPATGVVIVPSSFTATQLPDETAGVCTLNADTAIVSTADHALNVESGIDINTNGYDLVAVSLYEGADNTSGICGGGDFTISGGGAVTAVGGMTNSEHESYGVGGTATINATGLTANGSTQAMQNAPTLKSGGKDIAVKVAGAYNNPLIKIVPAYQVFVGATQVTDLNKDDVLGDGKVSYDPSTKTLTLNGAEITGGIVSNGLDLTLNLDGTNAVENSAGHGISADSGNLTISGSGSLTATGTGGHGISVGGNLTISGSGDLTATGGDVTSDSSYGISCDETLTVDGATVTAIGGNITNSNESSEKESSGVSADNVVIQSGADLTATGGTATASGSAAAASYGVHSAQMTVSSSTVTAKGDTLAISMPVAGDPAAQTIPTISGCNVTASTSADGTSATAVTLDADNLTTFKYIHAVPTPPSTGGSYQKDTSDAPASQSSTQTNEDGSTTTTTKTTKPDGTEVTTAVTESADGSSETVTSTEKTQSDGSTVKTETTVTTDESGNVTGAAAAVTTDSATGAVTVPAEVITSLAEAENATLTIAAPNVTIELDSAALKALASEGGEAPALVITPVPFEELPEKAQEELTEAATFSFDVNGGGLSFGSGTVTVTLDYTRKADDTVITVFYVDDEGNMTRMPGAVYENGKVTYKTNHFSLYAIEEEEMPFEDVALDSYCVDAVLWALGENITTGITATTFAPDNSCTRAQAVTFLWRAMGSPEPALADCPFTDVSTDAYYYKAVLWAVENGITSGITAATFAPDAACTRSQIVTFLYRAAGSPAVTGGSDFDDVAADAYFANAVGWAVEQGVTTGMSETSFAPGEKCTRAQIVTFLYRHTGNQHSAD